LHFKRAFIDTTVHDAIKAGPTLIIERRRGKVRIASINGWAATQKFMCECPATIVLQWAK
jgi:hypothetical protein